MDSIRSPGKLQGQFLEFTWSLHGVHVDLSLGTDTYSLYTPYILLIYSSWTPDGLHLDAYFSRTPDSLLSIPEQESRRTPQKIHKYSVNLNLIYNVIKKQISLQRFEPYLLSKLCLTTQPQVVWSPSKIETHAALQQLCHTNKQRMTYTAMTSINAINFNIQPHYPTPELWPNYICINMACMVLWTAIINHSW